MTPDERKYLGDGVYAWSDGFHLVLEAEADGQLNRIYLDPHVLDEVTRFMENIRRPWAEKEEKTG